MEGQAIVNIQDIDPVEFIAYIKEEESKKTALETPKISDDEVKQKIYKKDIMMWKRHWNK